MNDTIQIAHDGYFRYDCVECGAELLFPRLMGNHPGDAVRPFCGEACYLLWKDKHPEEWAGTATA